MLLGRGYQPFSFILVIYNRCGRAAHSCVACRGSQNTTNAGTLIESEVNMVRMPVEPFAPELLIIYLEHQVASAAFWKEADSAGVNNTVQ